MTIVGVATAAGEDGFTIAVVKVSRVDLMAGRAP